MDVSVVIVWVLFLLKALIGLVANFAIIALGKCSPLCCFPPVA